MAELTRIKQKYAMETVRRKSLTLNDLRYRLNLTDDDISEMINSQSGLRIRPVNTILQDGTKVENIAAEYYEDKRIYGTFIQKYSPLTIISPLSNEQPFLGHFTHAIAEKLNANYLSVEKFSKSDFNPKKVLDFVNNSAFFQEDSPEAIFVFKEDVIALMENTKTFIIFGAKASKGHTYELLNGGKAGDRVLFAEDSSFSAIETLQKFSQEFNVKLSIDAMSLGIHEDNGITGDFHLMHYLHRELGANVFQLNVSANLLKDNSELYYKSVYVLSETIKENF